MLPNATLPRNLRLLEVLRIARKLETESSARILGAMGHPGYGDQFALEVLEAWVARGGTLHQYIYRPVRGEGL